MRVLCITGTCGAALERVTWKVSGPLRHVSFTAQVLGGVGARRSTPPAPGSTGSCLELPSTSPPPVAGTSSCGANPECSCTAAASVDTLKHRATATAVDDPEGQPLAVRRCLELWLLPLQRFKEAPSLQFGRGVLQPTSDSNSSTCAINTTHHHSVP